MISPAILIAIKENLKESNDGSLILGIILFAILIYLGIDLVRDLFEKNKDNL